MTYLVIASEVVHKIPEGGGGSACVKMTHRSDNQGFKF